MAMMLILAGFGLTGGLTDELAWAESNSDDMISKGHHKGVGKNPMKILKKLDLTDEQQDQADKIKDEYKPERQAIKKNMAEARKNLKATVIADTFNEQDVRTAAQALAPNIEEMAVLNAKIFSEIRQILTPEQITKMKELQTRQQEQRRCHKKCKELMAE